MESGNNKNNCKWCPRIDQTDVWHTIIIRTSYQQTGATFSKWQMKLIDEVSLR